jgi:hypothetical protein
MGRSHCLHTAQQPQGQRHAFAIYLAKEVTTPPAMSSLM